MIKRSRLFDKDYYLINNPDVKNAGINALRHFISSGWKESRSPSQEFDFKYYLSMNEDVKQWGGNPLIHYIKFGEKEHRNPNPLSYRQRLIQNSNEVFRKGQKQITLYIHLGQDKTGTSAIQSFLDINRITLFSQFGCLYPNFEEADRISGVCNNHVRWYREVVNDEDRLLSDFNRTLEFCSKYHINKIIISNEGFFLKDDIINTSKILSENNLPIKIKPICYLRRIDHWVESAWKQWGIKQYDHFDEFVGQPEHFQVFNQALKHFKKWTEIIDKSNIHIRPYEKQQLEFGLLHDFLSIVGIDHKANKWQEGKRDLNIGYNRDVVALLHLCRNLFVDVHDNHLFHVFTDLLGDDFSKKPFESYNLLSPRKRLELINHNLPYEKEIAMKFMGREDGRIFFEPLPDANEAWEPYQGLTMDKAIPIIIKLIESLQIKINA